MCAAAAASSAVIGRHGEPRRGRLAWAIVYLTGASGRFDLAVIGGGPAGAAVAIRATQLGLAVAVIDAPRASELCVGEAVPADLERPLRRLGAWDAFLADGHLPAAGPCSAWGEAAVAWSDRFAFTHGGGWHLDRARFDATLRCAARTAGATVLDGGRVLDIERSGGEWRLDLAGDARPLRARFLVDATGRAAVIARRLGARRLEADRTIAIHAALGLDGARTAIRQPLLETVEHGWWYAARVPGGRMIVSLFSDADVARSTGGLAPAGWHRLFASTRHIAPLLGAPAAPARVHSVSAASHCLDRLHGSGWLAVGDAACAVDPLAASGIFLALDDGVAAGDAIARALCGDGRVLDAHGRVIRQRFSQFLSERRDRYALETRWQRAEFWRRRAGPPPGPVDEARP